jgi:hypothetical protein
MTFVQRRAEVLEFRQLMDLILLLLSRMRRLAAFYTPHNEGDAVEARIAAINCLRRLQDDEPRLIYERKHLLETVLKPELVRVFEFFFSV